MLLVCDVQQFNSKLESKRNKSEEENASLSLKSPQMTNKVYLHINGKLGMQALTNYQIYFQNLKKHIYMIKWSPFHSELFDSEHTFPSGNGCVCGIQQNSEGSLWLGGQVSEGGSSTNIPKTRPFFWGPWVNKSYPKFWKCFIFLSLKYIPVTQPSEVQFSWRLSFLTILQLSNLEKGVVRQAAWHNGKYTRFWNLAKLDLNPGPDT